MGSGSSTIKNIHIDQDKSQDASKAGNGIKVETLATKPIGSLATKPQSRSHSEGNSDRDSEVAVLTRQLCESESQRLDLEDRVQVLEERLADFDSRAIETEERSCDQTLLAKDQYIAKLEKEKAELGLEHNKLKQRHRKKVKQMTAQMSEFKQETNFQMMEMREEIQKLMEEKAQLQGNEPTRSAIAEEVPKLPGGEKMKLILELSEQVTEQGDKISKLEHKVKEKDHVIEELRTKLRNSADYLKVVDEKKKGSRPNSDDKNNNNNNNNVFKGYENNHRISLTENKSSDLKDKQGVVLSGNIIGSNRSSLDATRNAASALFAVEEESDEFADSGNMMKLSSLLQGIKAPNDKARISVDSLTGDSDGSRRRVEGQEDERTDSGLGSAGKREEHKTTPKKSKHWNIYSEWKEGSFSMESGSGLSDSDFEPDRYKTTKVSSAPPKMQNVGNSKPKKKTNSLRRRAGDKHRDLPPKPGIAFAGTDDVDTDHLMKVLSPIMSPVEVS